ncbi:alpha/beta hydrolase [Fodinicola feengrottensis]|uniref:alpha/beta hydrolase n=1 Tax=Fodinicola feengrottensis TaxID=435914 RepID=UPI0031D86044
MSRSLLAVLALLFVGFTAVTVITWDRWRFKMPRRIIGLLLSQVLLVAFAAAWINRQEYFFTSWSDLLGLSSTSGPPGGTVASRGKPVPKPPNSQLSAPATFSAKIAKLGGAGGHSVVEDTYVSGSKSGITLPMTTYVPAAYFDKANANKRFPVVQLFSGYPGSLQTWTVGMQLQSTLDTLINQHKMQPVIAEVALQYPSPPRDSECVNAAGGDQVDTFLTQDVPDYLKAALRTATDRTGWATMGVSTGGFCAANLALRHPTEYASVVSIGGYFDALIDDTTGDLYGGSTELREANSPTHTVQLHNRPPMSFYLFAIEDDPSSYPSTKNFIAAVKPPDGLAVVLQPTGGHNDGVWRSASIRAWQWLGSQLKT